MPDSTHTPTKRSIALVIRHGEDVSAPGCGAGPRWLLVLRPDDDEDLPGVWGLAAGTLEAGETPEQLVRRIGREKLGLRVDPGAHVASGSAARSPYTLVMELWTATIVEGNPEVSGPVPSGRTRYAAWKWDDPAALEEGARAGSLCCRLGLQAAGYAAE